MSLPGWLADPALAPVWEVLHSRLERHGPGWRGRVTFTDLTPASQRALSDLLGRPLVGASCRLDVADLDARLLAAGGLLPVVELATGALVVDRRTERELAAARADEPVEAARAELPEAPWVPTWLVQLRRLGPAVVDARAAAKVLAALGTGREGSRVDLAAQLLGDAHALDDDSPVAGLVLRGLALRWELELPLAAEGRRELWRLAGVSGDAVSSTCLILGLPLLSGGLARRLADGDPVHVTRRDLARYEVEVASGTRVLVCENPRVLEAIADSDLGVAVVCGNGNPNLVTLEVVRRLAASGAVLDYHGDFDWPGIAIAGRLLAAVGARPWAMSARDYLAAPAGVALRGAPVQADWEPGLTEAMLERGCVVHEESVLDTLLERLRQPSIG